MPSGERERERVRCLPSHTVSDSCKPSGAHAAAEAAGGGRALTEMQHDCRETQEALQEVMDNPVMLAGVCLGEAQVPALTCCLSELALVETRS